MADTGTLVMPGQSPGDSSSIAAPNKKKNMLIAGGIGVVLLAGAFLYSRSKSSSAAASQAATGQSVPEVIYPSMNTGSSATADQYDSLMTGIANLQGNLASNIAASQTALEQFIQAQTPAATAASGTPDPSTQAALVNVQKSIDQLGSAQAITAAGGFNNFFQNQPSSVQEFLKSMANNPAAAAQVENNLAKQQLGFK